MIPLRRPLPPLWQRHRLLPLLSALVLGTAPLQSHADGIDAATASTPGASLPATDLSALEKAAMASLPADLREALQRWRQVNQQVGEFPRGHIDLLRWEARHQPASPATEKSPEAPLGADEVWRHAAMLRPELVERPGRSGLERWAGRLALIELQRDARRAWTEAVTTQATLRLAQARLENARVGAELGTRMVQAGNWSQARLLREQVLLADEQAAWLQASVSATSAREALARMMGLWRTEDIQALAARLPANLPDIAPADQPQAATEDEVLASDPMLMNLRAETAREAAAVPPEQRQRWRDALTDALTQPGALAAQSMALSNPQLLRDHPLEAAVEADARLLQAAVARRSWAREAWQRLQATQAMAQHIQKVSVPLRQAAEQETLLRYNGMLQSTWDLLAAARERLQAEQSALDARRQHAMALADWQALRAGASYQPEGLTQGSTASTTSNGGH